MSIARLALAAARPYVSAAVNTGGGQAAFRVLQLIDQALIELRPPEPRRAAPTPHQVAQAGEWAPEGGWHTAPDEGPDNAA